MGAEDKIAGVPIRIITPPTIPANKQDRVLIQLHGGGFRADWGSVAETIPITRLHGTETKVIAIRYRLAPEYPLQLSATTASRCL